MQTIDMSEVKEANRRRGHHWFERSTMRFFNSRVGSTAYRGAGGTYFVSSEQFVSSTGQASPRKYSVRRQQDDGSIDTIGGFNSLSRSIAIATAKRYAEHGEV